MSLTKDDLRSTIKSCVEEVMEDKQPEFIRINEAAEMLGLSRMAIYGLVNRKRIPYCKIGKYLYFSRYDLDSWIRSGEQLNIQEINR